jgi:peptidyl-prolyl cis-trans isomerase SurA
MNKAFILLLAFFMALTSSSYAQRSDSIAAVVNDDVITYTDLYDRMNLVIKSSRMPNTTEFKERLLPQVLTGLITEQIQMQEADRLGLETTQEEIDRGFAELAGQNNLEAEQFKTILRRDGINIKTLEKQIESQLAWGKVIQREIRPRVQLTDSDINNEIERLKRREGQEEYFIAEIFLPYGEDSDASEKEVRTTANDLSRQLKADVQKFPAAARQFSQSATAASGGIIGWVTADQMDEEISLTLNNMDVGDVSQPVKTNDGYSIIFMREKRTVDLSMGEGEERLRVKIATFDLPDDQATRRSIRDDVDLFMRDVKGCLDNIEQVTKRDYATLRDFDDTKSNLPANILSAIDGVNIGDVREKIETENTIQVPMVCGRDGGGSSVALEREVEGRMGMQRMDVLQKRYLRDLIADAYIERRV